MVGEVGALNKRSAEKGQVRSANMGLRCSLRTAVNSWFGARCGTAAHQEVQLLSSFGDSSATNLEPTNVRFWVRLERSAPHHVKEEVALA